MFVDKLTERGSVFVDPSSRLSTSDVEIDILTSDGKYRGVGLINNVDGSISFPDTLIKFGTLSDTSVNISVTDGLDDDGNTVAYSTTKGYWMSLYSFNPEMYANLHNRFFSFENGQMYRHNVNNTNNNFYGTQYNSSITIISRVNPSMVKVYNAISLEGDDNWSAVITNSSQSTSIGSGEYEVKEGLRYSVIPKDTSGSSTDSSGSNKVVLGEVASVSGNTVTFTSRISNLPFGLGDRVNVLSESSETETARHISSVDSRTSITLNDTPGVSVGDTLIAVSHSSINGDHMRDYYSKVKLTNTNTADVELYAVNMVFTPSPLHNEQQEN